MQTRSHVLLALMVTLVGVDIGMAAGLTFEDRVEARRAILQHSARHRSDSVPPSVPRRLAEDQVRRSLQQSLALDQLWSRTLTAELLGRELDRVIRQTRDPGRLGQLFRVLEHDPLLIQEVLIRPALADRLARRYFQRDAGIHGEARWEDWWSSNAPAVDVEAFRAPTPVPISLPATTPSCAVGQGWDNGILDGVDPVGRYDQTLVWTGSELLLWGGIEAQWSTYEVMGDGYRYDPLLELWSPISAIGGPGPRAGHQAIWTGAEMIVWGGWDGVAESTTGYRYDPVADTWSQMATSGAPGPRSDTVVIWTGSEMIVWGGQTSQAAVLGDGARYDPQTDSWSPVATAGAPSPRYGHSGVWTGGELVVWGGSPSWNTYTNTGGRYDPATDSWTATTTFHAPAGRRSHAAAWTGSRMIVFGGYGGQFERSGARYDPVADSWASMPQAPSTLLPFDPPVAAWTGADFVVELQAGGMTGYSPSANGWSTLPCFMRGQQVWSGSELLVWGDAGFVDIDTTGWKYDPQAATCDPLVPPPDGPVGRRDHTGVWTGAELIVWGGRDTSYNALGDGKRYDPVLDAWSPISSIGAPTGRIDHSAIWTGTEMIVWGGRSPAEQNTGGRYDPMADSWTPTSTAGTPAARSEHSAIWTGTEMIVWGGDLSFPMGEGGRYDPASDSWLLLSAEGEPSPRAQHSAVWTGTEMIVWGGSQVESRNTGGRYDPASDSWSATTTVDAPQQRFGHSAVWTGDEMIVWGGNSDVSTDLGDGSRYDPAADSWSPVSLDEAPAARFWHSAVWNGSSMMVWGGRTLDATLFAGGAIYDPGGDSWSPIDASAAPPPRYGQTAAWTGDAMMVWGGAYTESQNGNFDKTGGRYVYSPDDDGDGVGLACDCAPEDAGAFAVPAEITGLVVSPDKATIGWASDAPNSGSGTLYQLLRGQVGQLPVGSGAETCLEPGTSSTTFTDAAEPGLGSAFFYLVRGVNACSSGTYGLQSGGGVRVSGACP